LPTAAFEHPLPYRLQRQRVTVVRARADDPPPVLADGPTGSLDTKSSATVFAILEGVVRDGGKTVVAVAHDPVLTPRCGRRIELVDGRLVADARTPAWRSRRPASTAAPPTLRARCCGRPS
jgi:ABC-type ATPase involved in cell division